MKLEKASRLMEEFENCTLPKEEWTHVSHFIMALWYCIKFPLPQATQKIKSGIMKYNVSVGGENTAISGYHETITLFYITKVVNYLVTNGVTTLTDETITTFLQQPFLMKDYILQCYNKEVLMSSQARLNWLAPDKMDTYLQNLNPALLEYSQKTGFRFWRCLLFSLFAFRKKEAD